MKHKFEDLHSLASSVNWIEYALRKILRNTGAKTSGTDGISKVYFLNNAGKLSNSKIRSESVIIADELRTRRYKASPVKRHYIPKPNSKEMRPLGIPTIRDRTVQQVMKMILEPIWESDFLDYSNGFRPLRRTWHCIAPLYRWVYNKYYYVIEGDIRKFFDTLNHKHLLMSLSRRIGDRKILAIVKTMLKSGIMDEGLFSNTYQGSPQGGVCSPLLSNIYLHEFDEWFLERWGKLTKGQRSYRRGKGAGHFFYLRYADDWIVPSNAKKAIVTEEREAIRLKLKDMRLELNMDKTNITHIIDGFNFLGFNLRMVRNRNTPTKQFFLILPRKESIQRFKRKIKLLTSSRKKEGIPNTPYRMKLIALNRIIRGWGYYYRYAHSKETFASLDWFIQRRLDRWLDRKTNLKLSFMRRKAKYGIQITADKWVWGSKGLPATKERDIYLFSLSGIPILSDPRKVPKSIRQTPKGNPFIEDQESIETGDRHTQIEVDMSISDPDEPIVLWSGHNPVSKHPPGWYEKARRTKSYDTKCVECGATTDLTAHFRRDKHEIGRLNRTLCRECHNDLTQSLKTPPTTKKS